MIGGKKIFPNFLIIGAHKAGTTSLYHYLNQHPKVYLSPAKEPRFFSLSNCSGRFNGPNDPSNRCRFTTLDSYQELFKDVKDEKAVGEASTLYLYDKDAPNNIFKYNKEMKMIVVLRNPIERAYSNYTYARQKGHEEIEDFSTALDREEERINNGWGALWHYKQKGFYSQQLKRYYELFNESQLKVFLYDDLIHSPQKVVHDIYQFLSVDCDFEPDFSTKYNPSGVPTSMVVQRLIMLGKSKSLRSFRSVVKKMLGLKKADTIWAGLQKANLNEIPVMSSETRDILRELYKHEILRLQTMIERDLSHWN